MHEMSIAMSILDEVEKHAKDHNVERVEELVLEIGMLSGIEIDALKFALDAIQKNSVLANTEVKIHSIEGLAKCLKCTKEYTMKELYDSCPTCSSYFKDIVGGRTDESRSIESQLRSANEGQQYYIDTVVYSPDGSCDLASGNSRFVCCYYVAQQLLVRRWSVSNNMSLAGVRDMLNSRALTEGGVNISMIDSDPSGNGLSNTVGSGDVSSVGRGSGKSGRWASVP